MSNSKMVMSQAANSQASPTYIEDVFSTYLYTGNGATQTINNGIDLAGEGGLWWGKQRDSSGRHWLLDSARGGNIISTNLTDAQLSAFASSPFTSTGISFTSSNSIYNASGSTYASWTFRKAPRFFDVVTYTGTGSARTIAHNLGVVPGCIIVKCTSSGTVSFAWNVYHRSLPSPAASWLLLNSTNAAASDSGSRWNNTLPTSSVFSVNADDATNASGQTYVAYLFAHDPLGPSGDGSDGLIACGVYVGNGSSNGPEITLGWEPQWVLTKRTDLGADWEIKDTMRGMSSAYNRLWPNLSTAEDYESDGITPTARGFKLTGVQPTHNASGGTYIYIAIRRGPMREPTVGTEVFNTVISSGATAGTSASVGFPVDLTVFDYRTAYNPNYMGIFQDRLRGYATANTSGTYPALSSTTTQAETALSPGNPVIYGVNNAQSSIFYGTNASTGSSVVWNFRRAPGFFDVVAYTGNGVAGRTVPHNLGVAPEMMIVKCRSQSTNWPVYHSGLNVDGDGRPETDYLILNQTQAAFDNVVFWNDTAPDSSAFTLGTNVQVNQASSTYIAYLFATLPGISKVGSYTGNGSSQTINCAFTTGARFVLIKRTDSTGDWYVWDTARGIVTGNDPHLSLNTTAAEVTNNDTIDPNSSGFIVNQVAATNVNVNAASYIYLAIA